MKEEEKTSGGEEDSEDLFFPLFLACPLDSLLKARSDRLVWVGTVEPSCTTDTRLTGRGFKSLAELKPCWMLDFRSTDSPSEYL